MLTTISILLDLHVLTTISILLDLHVLTTISILLDLHVLTTISILLDLHVLTTISILLDLHVLTTISILLDLHVLTTISILLDLHMLTTISILFSSFTNKQNAFCFACRHFGSSKDLSFVEVGFSNWKHAKASKSKGLNVHASSDCHINAIVAWAEHKRMQSSSTSVGQILNEAHQRAVEENRHYIKTVAEILYTGRQNIAHRAYREQDDAAAGLNKGNFLELLSLIGKHDSKIAKKIEGLNENAKYTSPQIQNEVLQILVDMVREQIMEEVITSGQFVLIVDETKDVSKTEQISFVLRYFYNESVYETFLTFQAAE